MPVPSDVQRAAPRLEPGDVVLTWWPEDEPSYGVILGRLTPSRIDAADDQAVPAEMPEEVVLEAKQRLRLECGDSSVELRPDGRILIKGTDVVSRATRSNRIKGGSVQIN